MDLTQQIKRVTGRDIYVGEYEEVKKSDRVNSAGCASYVERNQLIIDDSNIVVLYLIENKNKQSGAKIASEYAQKKRKEIFNIFFIADSLKSLEKSRDTYF